jgi:hypothetical protein
MNAYAYHSKFMVEYLSIHEELCIGKSLTIRIAYDNQKKKLKGYTCNTAVLLFFKYGMMIQ